MRAMQSFLSVRSALWATFLHLNAQDRTKLAKKAFKKEAFPPNLTRCDHYFLTVMCQNVLQKQTSGKTPNETRENVDCTSAWNHSGDLSCNVGVQLWATDIFFSVL